MPHLGPEKSQGREDLFKQVYPQYLLLEKDPSDAATKALQYVANPNQRPLIDAIALRRFNEALVLETIKQAIHDHENLRAAAAASKTTNGTGTVMGTLLSTVSRLVSVAGSDPPLRSARPGLKTALREAIPKAAWQKLLLSFGDFAGLNGAFLPAPRGDGPLPDFSKVTVESPDIDFDRLHEFYSLLTVVMDEGFDSTAQASASGNIFKLCEGLAGTAKERLLYANQLRFILILLENPQFDDLSDFTALLEILRTVNRLGDDARNIIIGWYAHVPMDILQRHVALVQQTMTITIVTNEGRGLIAETGPVLRSCIAFLEVLYKANLQRIDALDFKEFYNDAINASETLLKHGYDVHVGRAEMQGWMGRNQPHRVPFMEFPFVLDAASKMTYMRLESTARQRQVMTNSVFQSLLMGQNSVQPFLGLHVRRESLIQDALHQLSLYAEDNPNTLRKQLRVKFQGEEGIDEGGVAKEFFQLLVGELFNPDYGMFVEEEEARLYWFNPSSLENAQEFELIGIVLGLAIYNGVILDVHFPLAVYKKLLGWIPGPEDLKEIKPTIARSLDKILEASTEDLIAMDLSCSVSYDRYGETIEEPLGDLNPEAKVSLENRQHYVSLMRDWLLNKSVASQFSAFYAGFHKCCSGAILPIFRPEELLMVICGSTELDFQKLRETTNYQDGFTSASETVKDFWGIVLEELSENEQKRLLAFVTGSDRSPIKGLASLQFVIGRNGPDSNKLPTAHTCFNYLLLPDYKDKAKLARLLKLALENYQGFGLR